MTSLGLRFTMCQMAKLELDQQFADLFTTKSLFYYFQTLPTDLTFCKILSPKLYLGNYCIIKKY